MSPTSTNVIGSTRFAVDIPAGRPVSMFVQQREDANTIAAIWDLAKPQAEHAIDGTKAKEIRALLPSYTSSENVSATNTDRGMEKNLVQKKDYGPGGRYRAIVKLVMGYKGMDESRFMGTGWLINDDIIVTAGHNAFNWQGNRGQPGEVVEVEAYIGYQGRATLRQDIASGQVQYRRGKSVVTTTQYISNYKQRNFNFALIQLDRPFNDVTPIRWRSTPMRADGVKIGVVGYPGDKNDDGEAGAKMYEMFLPITFDLRKADLGMLEYGIDILGGSSGAPVLTLDENDKLVSTGVHTYGGMPSTGIAIGKYGIPLLDYLSSFLLRSSPKSSAPLPKYSWAGLKLIEIPNDREE